MQLDRSFDLTFDADPPEEESAWLFQPQEEVLERGTASTRRIRDSLVARFEPTRGLRSALGGWRDRRARPVNRHRLISAEVFESPPSAGIDEPGVPAETFDIAPEIPGVPPAPPTGPAPAAERPAGGPSPSEPVGAVAVARIEPVPPLSAAPPEEPLPAVDEPDALPAEFGRWNRLSTAVAVAATVIILFRAIRNGTAASRGPS